MNTNRLEAFSDGVIAVAITLLVLGISVPEPHRTHSLVHALLRQWQLYAAYATSFLTIGIIWINHHVMISRLREADRTILLLNLLLLMSIGVLPFSTDLIATYLKAGHGEHFAAGVYAGSFLAMGIAFAVLNHHILMRKPDRLNEDFSAARRRFILARSVSGVIPYAVATALAVVSPYATLAICGALAIFYALPAASGESARVRHPL